MNQSRPRGTWPDIVWHHMPHGFPHGELVTTESSVGPEDLAIAGRVLEAFERARAHEQSMRPESIPNDGIWEMMKHVHHGEIYKALFDRDVPALAGILASAQRQPITHGLGPGKVQFATATDPATAPGFSAQLIDRFIALAEAVGAIWYENPEQGRWGVNAYLDLSLVRTWIEQAVGSSIRMPPCGGIFGVRVGDAIVSTRTSDNVYAAWRIAKLLGNRTDAQICEIGAGLGGTAFYALGQRAAGYTIIDLPVINVLQGYLLIKTCGANKVCLFGEADMGRPVRRDAILGSRAAAGPML